MNSINNKNKLKVVMQVVDQFIKEKPIAVLGAGAWGCALAIVLARNGNPVRLWDVDATLVKQMQADHEQKSRLPGIAFPKNLVPVETLKEAVDGVQDICLVVPSFAFDTVLKELRPIVSDDVRFVWGTKGLNPSNAGFLHEVVFDVFSPAMAVAVLSGPSFAKEAAEDLPTMVSLAGNNATFLADLSDRFNGHQFRVRINQDLIGVQLCGVVKNVIAIATGLVDGMGFGANTRCALITRGLSEMMQLCVALGGQHDTVTSLAGMGDLILTCTDNQSRNRRLGLVIGGGQSSEDAVKAIGESVEGYYNAKQLNQLAQDHQIKMPLVSQVYQILYGNQPVDTLVEALLK